ncbi:MAG: hypothetical protein IPK04_22405 [Bdellovibrionales bacterium]|nr:hypothetical protein [Bdellovibrionales bacterium]
MELITNYAHLVKAAAIADSPLHKKRFKRRQNFEKKLGYNLGVLRISLQDTNEEYHPVVLHPRGHSRRSSWVCPTAPPLRVFFLDRKIKQSLDAALEQKNVHPGEPNYLQMYYNEFLKINILPTEKTMAPDEGIFSKLGSELKLVTHCDAQTGEDDDPDLEPIEKRRIQAVFREFALYEMLQPLRWPVERVRLLNISYFNESGKPMFHQQNQSEKIKKMVGFFREPQKSVAKRCGLDHKAFIKRGREVNAAFYQIKRTS